MPIPQKKKYKFVTQMKSTTEGEYYWLISVFSWESFDEYVKCITGIEGVVCYTKIPVEILDKITLPNDLPF